VNFLSQQQKPNGQMVLSAPDEMKATETWMFSGKPVSVRRRRLHMTISPALAANWLEHANTNNRNLSETTVTQYACDMLDGRWFDNGDAIRFRKDGVLLDGQHRLKACVEAKLPFNTDVIFGLEAAARDTIDIGRVRTAANIVQFEGTANSIKACALAHMLIIHREVGIQRMNNAGAKPTKTKVIQLVRSDSRIPVVAGHLANSRAVPPRVAAFCYYLFSEQDVEKCEKFFRDLSSGVGLDVTSPVYHLRERLNNNRNAKAKLPMLEIIALFFKAWVAYRDGKQVRVLRWSSGGATPEAFPEL
jgi:hypothetical protein